MLQSKVIRIHVLAVCLRLDNEVSNLIKELNLFSQRGAANCGYIYHGVASKLAHKNIFKFDKVHLDTRGNFNLQSLIRRKIINRF